MKSTANDDQGGFEGRRAEQIIEAVLATYEGTPATITSPSIQWYPKDWAADEKVKAMSLAARGLHFELIQFAWRASEPPCSIPDDQARIREEFGGREFASNEFMPPESIAAQTAAWSRIWTMTASAWVEYKGRLWQLGLCKAYLKMVEKRIERTSSGARGAAKKWKADSSAIKTDGSAIAQLPGTLAKPSSSIAEPGREDSSATVLDSIPTPIPIPSSFPTPIPTLEDQGKISAREPKLFPELDIKPAGNGKAETTAGPAIAKKRGGRAKPVDKPDNSALYEAFDQLWKVYPPDARGDFISTRGMFALVLAGKPKEGTPPATFEEIFEGLKPWLRHWEIARTDPAYIPLLRNFLHRRDWQRAPLATPTRSLPGERGLEASARGIGVVEKLRNSVRRY